MCHGVDDRDPRAAFALEAAHSEVRVYQAGDVVYVQGDPSERLFNVMSGWVALHRDLADGRRQITRFLQPGAMFGMAPAGEDLAHAASAITNATVGSVQNAKFDELRRQLPSLNEQFIVMLEREYQSAIKTLTMVGQGNARERIGALLWELAVTAIGEAAIHAGAVLKIPLTQRHIAEATGLTSIHVNRVLRQLREDLVIELHYGKLTILDAIKLHVIAEPGASGGRGARGQIEAGPGASEASAGDPCAEADWRPAEARAGTR